MNTPRTALDVVLDALEAGHTPLVVWERDGEHVDPDPTPAHGIERPAVTP